MLLFFLSILCESTEFLHYDDGPLLNCKEIGDDTVLVSPKASLPGYGEVCVCESEWNTVGYGFEADASYPFGCNNFATRGMQIGCTTDCLGGSWCKVANEGCLTEEYRHVQYSSIIMTPCDEYTPVRDSSCENECLPENPTGIDNKCTYCGCNLHTDCQGYTFCSSACHEGICNQQTNVCQPCERCDDTENGASGCTDHCSGLFPARVAANTSRSIEWEKSLRPVSAQYEFELHRATCLSRCLAHDRCSTVIATDAYLFVSLSEWLPLCAFGVGCVSYWAPGSVKAFPEIETERWIIMNDITEASKHQCTSSFDCQDQAAEFANCCRGPFDRVPVCARYDSYHCTGPVGSESTGNCVDDEHFCPEYRGDLKCLPKNLPCPTNLHEWQPCVMISLALIVIVYHHVTEYISEHEEVEPDGSFFASYSRKHFVEGQVTVPQENRPKWKFKYNVENPCFVFSNIWNTSIASSMPHAFCLAMCTLVISWLGAWGRLAKNDGFNEAALVNTTRAIADIWASLSTYVSVLLVFTVVNRLQWFFSVMKNMYKVQGAISSMGMFIGTRVNSKKERFKCYRWLNLAHLYLHQQTTPELAKRISDKNLLDCGLLTPKEFAQVDDALSKRRVVLGWLGRRLEYHFKGSFIIDKEYHELKECAHDVLKSINQTMPFSFLQTIIVLTYFWLLLMPFSMYYRLAGNAGFIVFEFSSCIATFFVSIIFLAILDVLVNISLPTGHDLDDINPEALLVETDESIVIFLGGGSEPEKQDDAHDSNMVGSDSIRGAIALVGKILPTNKKPLEVDRKVPKLLRKQSEKKVSFAELNDNQGSEVELVDCGEGGGMKKGDRRESMPLVLDKNIDSLYEGALIADSPKNEPRNSVPLVLDHRIDTAWDPEDGVEDGKEDGVHEFDEDFEATDQSELIDNTVHNQSIPKMHSKRDQSMADVMAGAILHHIKDVHNHEVDMDSIGDEGETKMEEDDSSHGAKR